MQDSVVEVLVDRKVSPLVTVVHIILMVITGILGVAAFVFLGLIALIPAIITAVAAYYVGLRTKLEYEYAYFDRELVVDVIYRMTKRKRVKTFDISKMEIFAPANAYQLDEYKNRNVKIYDYSSKKAENASQLYVMYTAGNEKVLLEPSGKMIQAIYNAAPRKVVRN